MNSGSRNSEWKELHELKELRDLKISNLNHGKDVALESKAANLKGKQLKRLELEWKRISKVNELSVGYDEQSLEAMQPQPKLEELVICNYGGVKFPSWMSSLTTLKRFSLAGCNKCQQLPPLEQLPNLKYLSLNKLDSLEYMSEIDYSEDSLEYMSEIDYGEELSNSSFIPSLNELKLSCCPNLKGWWRQRRDSLAEVDDDNNHLLPFFPGLSRLEIENCPKLTSMPLIPNVEWLKLDMCSLKPLKQTSTLQIEIANSSFAPLSKLKYLETGTLKEPLPNLSNLVSLCCRGPPPQGMQYLTSLRDMEIKDSTEVDLSKFWDAVERQGRLQSLEIRSCPNLISLPEGISGLTSLQTLEIEGCSKLKSLPEGMGGLTSLHTLEIEGCGKLKSLPEGMGGLTSLETLKIEGCGKLKSLPEGMGGLTSLQTLEIEGCGKLKSLPEGMGGLTSLHILQIWYCRKLKSLPEGIKGLTSLNTLKIVDCPILLKRCKRGAGEDWSKISHIPNLRGDLYQQ